MGASLAGIRLGGDSKPLFPRYCFRYASLLAAAFMLTLGLMGWTQPLDMRTVAVNWKAGTGSLFSLNPNSMQDLRDRGIGLLHSWTDTELFARVLAKEQLRNEKGRVQIGRKKIAFLFLVQRGVPLAPLWNKFFEGHEDLFNVYVHMWPLRLNTVSRENGAFWGRLIPSEDGGRHTPGLIADARRLLANAILDDGNNEWFAMVSETCIPIYGFQHVYNSLASTTKTFMEVNAKHWDMPNRYKARGDNAMLPEVPFSQFRVGSQFWVMRKRHALMAVSDTTYWNKFNHGCLDKYHNCFPEEHYFPTLLHILDPGGMIKHVTLVDWSKNLQGGHPRQFTGSEIDKDLIKELRERKKRQFLFARKFNESCLEPLLNVSDTLFSE